MRLAILALLAGLPLSANSSFSGGVLLDQSGADQLAAWLGQGDLSLTNIFSSAPVANGATSFHSAVNGQGPTFILIQTNLGLVGGYDPVSWNSNSAYQVDATDAGRTAFIFNLSSTTMLAQRLLAQGGGTDGDTGQYQTFGYSAYGPAFGGGHDLVINTTDLSTGYAYSYSYGGARGGSNIVGISNSASPTPFTVTRVEAFTFTTISTTPEPATFALCGGGFLLLALTRRKVRRHAAHLQESDR